MLFAEIRVVTAGNRLVRFQWKGGWYAVTSVEDEWVDTGEWWHEEGEKTFYRVSSGTSVFELYFDAKEKGWYMYRVYD
ncbi:Hypothetical protein DEACI_0089 [Acididesulfobacillus acetoxydans]|uniref:DUF6504 domain-containing protein n=1 Tax=Acididesulfobacillus acetoxydans TaxID=1561005 RepID=A0A8S0XUI5_9FIRM|nr:DUF6504 family protein [Acididesulfobacillus acetoxydans]CAA7599467.1 Hypothetical protein DEACI_0089 [Acididesulfobacillus acetoxydans]CEJ06728.1 Hypothetical protein DEACI_1178 [Acididesulfobacillus acetoxydans]